MCHNFLARDILRLDSSVCGPSLVGACPNADRDFLARVSSEWRRPIFDWIIFSTLARPFDLFLAMLESCAQVSLDRFAPKALRFPLFAMESLDLVSSDTILPKDEPAIGRILYPSGDAVFNAVIQYCSLSIRNSLRKTRSRIAKSKSSLPYLFQEFCNFRLGCF